MSIPTSEFSNPCSPCFFSPPDSTDLSLKCEDSKALSLQTCDFFQKISRSNLWLTDPWQLQISLFLSLLALHLVEKLSDSHLHRAAQVFIMCVHTEYPIWCTPQRLQPSARMLHTVTRARQPFILLYFSFLLRKILHIYYFSSMMFPPWEGRECGLRARTHQAEMCALSPPCFRFKTTLFYSENYAQSSPLSGQMGGKHLHLRHCAAANAETMWFWWIIIIHSTSEATWKVAERARLRSLHHGVRAGFAGASLCGNETAGSIIRSDGKSLCKVFCIITYQSQNSHPQILWVTKHQQLPHYCPPKSSPTNDKQRKREEREKKNALLHLRWGDRILIPLKGKEDYWPLVYRPLSKFRGSTNIIAATPSLKRRHESGGHAVRSISVYILWKGSWKFYFQSFSSEGNIGWSFL